MIVLDRDEPLAEEILSRIVTNTPVELTISGGGFMARTFPLRSWTIKAVGGTHRVELTMVPLKDSPDMD